MSKEEAVKTQSIQTKITPSFITQNLTCSNNFFAYINLQEDIKRVVVVKLKPDLITRESETIIQFINDIVTEIRYVLINKEWKLVIAGFLGFKIYSEDGKTCISNLLISKANSLAETKSSMIGIGILRCLDTNEAICVGCSTGEVYFAEYLGSQKFQTYVGLNLDKNTRIACITSSQTDNILAVGTTDGDLNLYLANTLKELVYLKKISVTQKSNAPITSLAVLERKLTNPGACNLLVSGDYLGQLRLYSLNEYCLVATINSHARMISQIDCNHATFEILSGSEDSFVNVWKVMPNNDISLSFSLSINDLCIVGASFVDKCSSTSPMLLTCYEQEEIHVVFRKQ